MSVGTISLVAQEFHQLGTGDGCGIDQFAPRDHQRRMVGADLAAGDGELVHGYSPLCQSRPMAELAF
jgi:hypothetical protein